MRTLHVSDKNTLLSFAHKMKSFHYVDLPNEQVIVACEFGDDGSQEHWQSLPAVTSLPHLLSPTAVLIALSTNVGVTAALTKFGLTNTDTTFTFFAKLVKVHPLMKP